MNALFNLIYQLIARKIGPQDLPHSQQLLIVVLAINIVISAAASIVHTQQFNAIFAVMIITAYVLGILWMILNLRGLKERWVQTATAWICVDTVFTLLMFPLVSFLVGINPEAKEFTGPQAFSALLLLLAFGWQVSIYGNILRHALNLTQMMGMLMVMLIFVVNFQISQVFSGWLIEPTVQTTETPSGSSNPP